MAVKNGHNSISFPAIGTGHLRFPKQEAAYIMLEAVAAFAQTVQTKMDVYFVIFPSDRDTFQVVFCIFCQDFGILSNNFFKIIYILITFSLKAFEGQMKSLQHKISNSSFRQGKIVKQCCSIRTLKNNTSAFLFSF